MVECHDDYWHRLATDPEFAVQMAAWQAELGQVNHKPGARPLAPVRREHEPEPVRDLYLQSGLCAHCADAAEWNHSIGFAPLDMVRPPCETCKAAVARLPRRAANGWRMLSRRQGRLVATRKARFPVAA